MDNPNFNEILYEALRRQEARDKHKPTNADRIRTMSDEELAEYLFWRGNGCEYCYGICAYQDECYEPHAQEFCIQQIVAWLKSKAEVET